MITLDDALRLLVVDEPVLILEDTKKRNFIAEGFAMDFSNDHEEPYRYAECRVREIYSQKTTSSAHYYGDPDYDTQTVIVISHEDIVEENRRFHW